MSFILEALKKSEKSRKNSGVPTLQTDHRPPVPEPARRPVWPLLLGAVLLLNALLVLWIFAPWKKDASQPPATAAILPGSGNVSAPAASLPVSPPAPAVPPPAVHPVTAPVGSQAPAEKSAPLVSTNEEKVRFPKENISAPAAVSPSLPSPDRSPSLDSHAAARPVALSPPARNPVEKPKPAAVSRQAGVDAPAEITPRLPATPLPAVRKEGDRPIPRTAKAGEEKNPVYEVNQLPQSLTSRVLPIHMSVHYYAYHPPARMVRINGQILREGAHMDSGPIVEEISPDGVILRYEGYRFLVRRAVPE